MSGLYIIKQSDWLYIVVFIKKRRMPDSVPNSESCIMQKSCDQKKVIVLQMMAL